MKPFLLPKVTVPLLLLFCATCTWSQEASTSSTLPTNTTTSSESTNETTFTTTDTSILSDLDTPSAIENEGKSLLSNQTENISKENAAEGENEGDSKEASKEGLETKDPSDEGKGGLERPNESESNEDDEGEDETDGDNEGELEEKCNFNQFLSGLNISHYLPKDRITLRDEFETFQDVPERIRFSPSVNYTIQRLKRLLNLASGITSRPELRSGFASFIQHNYELFMELELDAPCMTSLISVVAAIRRSELWAIKIIDSMAKPPPGLLSGVTSFLGDFEQCLSVKSPETANEEFSGQYCLLRPILPLPDVRKYSGDSDETLIGETKILNYLASYSLDHYVEKNPILKFIEHLQSHNGRVLNFAICLPDLCSPKQLEKSFNRLLYPIVGIPFEIQASSCWTQAKTKEFHLNRFTQFAIFIVSLLSALVCISTLYELYSNYLNKSDILAKGGTKANVSPNIAALHQKAHSLVYIFSAISNTRHLCAPNPTRIAVLDTLRLIIIMLIGLTTVFYNAPLSSGLRKLSSSVPYELLSDPKYFFVRAPSLLNDGLLVIAGTLFVRSIFKHLNVAHDKFSYVLFIFRRWLRLSVPLVGSILFLLILPLTGYGPLWSRLTDILLPACQSPGSLASSLFYYSNWNFVKSNHSNADAYVVCNPDTWFLSIIFQLNVAFLMIVVLLYQSPRNGLRFLVLLIISSALLNLSPRLLHANTRTYYELTKQPSLWHLRRNFYLYHQNIIQYVGSFSVGLLLGYAIVVHENKKPREPSRKTELFNWISVAVFVAVFAWVNQFFKQNASPSESSVLLFFSFGRLAFSLAFAWTIYSSVACHSLTFLRSLTAPLLQPLARLSFCIFLVQNLVLYHRMYSIKDTYVMTFRGTIENYIIDFIISSTMAYLLYILFEGPSQRINELLFSESTTHKLEGRKHYTERSKCTKPGPKLESNSAELCHTANAHQLPTSFEHMERSITFTHRVRVGEEKTNGTHQLGNIDHDFADNGIISIRF